MTVAAAGYFTFWVVLSLIWGLIASIVATILPIWEARDSLIATGYHAVGKGSVAKERMALKKSASEASMGKVTQAAPTPVTDDSAHAAGNVFKV